MSHFRKIDTRIWNDEKFNRLSHDAKLAFIFVLTHPNMTALGAMRGTVQGLSAELEVLPEAFSEAFSEGMLEADEKAKLIHAPNFIKYNRPESPNVVIAWRKAYDFLPECAIKDTILSKAEQAVKDYGEAYTKAFRKVFAKTSPNQRAESREQRAKDILEPTALVVTDDQPAESEIQNTPTQPSRNGCPYEKIRDLYHETLPALPECRVLTKKRKAQIHARWISGFRLKDGTASDSLDFWQRYFSYIGDSDFLTGKRDPPAGRQKFVADLEWITNESNFVKIIEGKYH